MSVGNKTVNKPDFWNCTCRVHQLTRIKEIYFQRYSMLNVDIHFFNIKNAMLDDDDITTTENTMSNVISYADSKDSLGFCWDIENKSWSVPSGCKDHPYPPYENCMKVNQKNYSNQWMTFWWWSVMPSNIQET